MCGEREKEKKYNGKEMKKIFLQLLHINLRFIHRCQSFYPFYSDNSVVFQLLIIYIYKGSVSFGKVKRVCPSPLFFARMILLLLLLLQKLKSRRNYTYTN